MITYNNLNAKIIKFVTNGISDEDLAKHKIDSNQIMI